MADRRSSVFIVLLILVSLLVVVSVPGVCPASGRTNVTDINYWSYPEYTRIVVTLSEKADFSQKRLSRPDRLYFDIKGSAIKSELKTSLPIGNGMLKSVRAAQFDEDTVRVVLDLEKVTEYKVFRLEDPERIVIDVFGAPLQPTLSMKKRIVIDPGHGGHDPGAVGPKKLYEKDVVLDIALKLKKLLSGNPNFEVYLTRDSDVFIPLEQRTAIANSKHADLFVSIHANASPHRDAKGIETYFLNWTNDEEAMKVAARENQISLKRMQKMQRERDVLNVMLDDLKRDNKRDESMALAHSIQDTLAGALQKDYSHTVDLGVKWAPFYVLFGAQMPSVLVEVSFISNPVEEKLLSRDGYRGVLAKSIASGITKYMAAIPDSRTVAAYGKRGGSEN
ncbi:MAG: N-acetylmuramoyl-L-alanine amidase [Nitrospiraceae bacterium]|nr:N-acetylmuramoyl-L-alanine amidase [Nitrospiraceae bacterium]